MRVDEISPRPVLRQVRGSEQIAEALQGVEFPITKQDLIARLGDRSLDWGPAMKAPLAEIVRGVPQARFGDRGQAQRAVSSRWMRIAKSLDAVEELEERRGPPG